MALVSGYIFFRIEYLSDFPIALPIKRYRKPSFSAGIHADEIHGSKIRCALIMKWFC
jgi:hypothetical protein